MVAVYVALLNIDLHIDVEYVRAVNERHSRRKNAPGQCINKRRSTEYTTS